MKAQKVKKTPMEQAVESFKKNKQSYYRNKTLREVTSDIVRLELMGEKITHVLCLSINALFEELNPSKKISDIRFIYKDSLTTLSAFLVQKEIEAKMVDLEYSAKIEQYKDPEWDEFYITEALGLLDDLCSSSDPIYYKGEETTPEELGYKFFDDTKASAIIIEFYGGKGLKRMEGSLITMIRDRMTMNDGRANDEKIKCSRCNRPF